MRSLYWLAVAGLCALCAQAEDEQAFGRRVRAARIELVQALDPAMAKIVETPEFKEHMGDVMGDYKDSTTQDVRLTGVAAGTPPDGASNNNYVERITRGANND